MAVFRENISQFGLSLALLILALGTGCGQGDGLSAVAEKDEKQYRYAEQMKLEDKTDAALTAFLQVSKARADDGPESHLEAGLILLNVKKDPVAAIYHFQKYLEAKPNSDQAPRVAQLINTAKKEFARTLPGNPNIYPDDLPPGTSPVTNLSGVALQNPTPVAVNVAPAPIINNTPSLSHPATPVRETTAPPPPVNPTPVVVAQVPVSPTAKTPPLPAATAPANSARTHVVQKGENLWHISQDVYHKNRMNDIYNANRDKLSSVDAPLKEGMVLKLPQ